MKIQLFLLLILQTHLFFCSSKKQVSFHADAKIHDGKLQQVKDAFYDDCQWNASIEDCPFADSKLAASFDDDCKRDESAQSKSIECCSQAKLMAFDSKACNMIETKQQYDFSKYITQRKFRDSQMK